MIQLSRLPPALRTGRRRFGGGTKVLLRELCIAGLRLRSHRISFLCEPCPPIYLGYPKTTDATHQQPASWDLRAMHSRSTSGHVFGSEVMVMTRRFS
jgi:hypothetical protein